MAVLSKSLSIPLNDSSWTCQHYLVTSQPEVAGLASNIASSTSQLSTSINGLSNQTVAQYFSPDSTAAAATADQLQKDVLSTGTTQITLKTSN